MNSDQPGPKDPQNREYITHHDFNEAEGMDSFESFPNSFGVRAVDSFESFPNYFGVRVVDSLI
jgi:hypothetical protein